MLGTSRCIFKRMREFGCLNGLALRMSQVTTFALYSTESQAQELGLYSRKSFIAGKPPRKASPGYMAYVSDQLQGSVLLSSNCHLAGCGKTVLWSVNLRYDSSRILTGDMKQLNNRREYAKLLPNFYNMRGRILLF